MEWPLSGLRVADLSAGIAGGYCTKVLADGGAEVIKLEPPAGDGLRGWSAGTPDAPLPAGQDGALFQFLACSKSGPAVHNRRHSPMLGEHNEDILSGLLGLTAGEIAQLVRDGIIGTRPASTDSSRGFT